MQTGTITTIESCGDDIYRTLNQFTFNGKRFVIEFKNLKETVTFTIDEALSDNFVYKDRLQQWPEIQAILKNSQSKRRGPFILLTIEAFVGTRQYSFEDWSKMMEKIIDEFPDFESFGKNIPETVKAVLSYSQKSDSKSGETWIAVIESPKNLWKDEN